MLATNKDACVIFSPLYLGTYLSELKQVRSPIRCFGGGATVDTLEEHERMECFNDVICALKHFTHLACQVGNIAQVVIPENQIYIGNSS